MGLALAAAVLLTAATSGFWPDRHGMEQRWSPYYRIDYDRKSQCLFTNLISHQSMIAREKPYPAYALPHLLNRDSGGPKFARILIIGAGSGNDLSRALQWAAPGAHIDAVEIDPVIQRIGTADHPNRPYDDARVAPRLDDGRNFLRAAAQDHPGEYDLIVYALVDSLVLHSGYSNIRLESYLFTEQAFADVRRCLKPDGVFAVYNYFRQGWIVARLRESLRETFANDPIVLTFPVRERVRLDEYFDGFTLFLAGPPSGTERLARTFERHPVYAVNTDATPDPDRTPDGFRTELPAAGQTRRVTRAEEEPKLPAPGGWVGFTPATVEESRGALRPPTDDWPFLYLREPTIPALTLRGMAAMALLSVGLMAVFLSGAKNPASPESSGRASGAGRFDARMFFLGAGFMLVETKAVVHMALLFGSTWMVNTVVFFAVLVMALLANLFVIKFRPRRLELYYVGLFAALGLNLLVPLDAFLGLNRVAQAAGACALVFAPIAFAGVIFATSFARSANPDRAFGWNVAGALAGGLAENFSMVLGFRYLLLVAVAFYALSLLRRRPEPAVVGGGG